MTEGRFWTDRRVLVTGCTGLLGSWLTQVLLDRKASVVGVVRDWVPGAHLVRSGAVDRIHVVKGEIQDQALVERALGEYEVATVFHLAAQTIVPIANANPVSTFDSNVRGTWSVLEASRRSPTVQEIIVASSDKAYGPQATLPYTEEMPLRGRHPYDVSKSCADLISQAYAETYGAPICITRCGNLYGGGDLNWNRLVPGTIRSALRGERPVIRSDGMLVRDYLYVEDAAEAYVTVAESLAACRDLAGHAFNFSYERPHGVLDFTRRILAAAGRPDLEPDVRAEASNEIREQHLHASKARRLLAWSPRLSLEEGLSRTVAWYRDFLADPAACGGRHAL